MREETDSHSRSPSNNHSPSPHHAHPHTFSTASPPDLRVRSDVWQGMIACVFQLASHEVTTMEEPPPYTMLVPRMSYFPLVLSEVRNHFRDATPAIEDELWLEYEGIPLKWNLPIGVLFDLLCPSSSQYDFHSFSSCTAPHHPPAPAMQMPWRLTVHFQTFPTEKLLRCRNLHTVRHHFINTFKEACYMKYGSNRVAMQATPQDQQRLWEGVTQQKEDGYQATVHKLVASSVVGTPQAIQASQSPGGLFSLVNSLIEHRSIEQLPIRIYVHCTRPNHEEGMNSESHLCPIQRSIKPQNKEGYDTTIADLIQQVLPTLIDPVSQGGHDGKSPFIVHTDANTPTPTSHKGAAMLNAPPSPDHNASHDATTPITSPTSVAVAPHSISLLPNVRLLVQGFTPPLSTPLWWLCTYCAHPDAFLYVCVQIVEVETEEERALRDPFAAAAAAGMMGGMNMSMSGHGQGSGLMGSMLGLNSLPGYYAASNAVNVVYQNLPSLPIMPSLPIAIPSVPIPSIPFFGAAGSSNSDTATGSTSPPPPQQHPQLSDNFSDTSNSGSVHSGTSLSQPPGGPPELGAVQLHEDHMQALEEAPSSSSPLSQQLQAASPLVEAVNQMDPVATGEGQQGTEASVSSQSASHSNDELNLAPQED